MPIARRPEWLKKKIGFNEGRATSMLLEKLGLNTVCKEAKCPNICECFKRSHATFLILGKYCTRSCSFCNVEKQAPGPLDPHEPAKVAEAVKELKLKHVVITSVTRDDLQDGGASHFVKTVEEIKKHFPVSIELLIPDFNDNLDALESVAKSSPDIIGHNLETVPRLYNFRPKANYGRSLYVLKHIKKVCRQVHTKSALMLGLGEKETEVLETMEDLRQVNCDFLALGQYLQPSLKHTEVKEYITPEQFSRYKAVAMRFGFRHVESSPYVRSSYKASEYLTA